MDDRELTNHVQHETWQLDWHACGALALATPGTAIERQELAIRLVLRLIAARALHRIAPASIDAEQYAQLATVIIRLVDSVASTILTVAGARQAGPAR